jgi:hypothetical protein
MSYQELASYRKCVERIRERWPQFLARRRLRLAEQHHEGRAPEKAAENILEDLFTLVLDWSLADLSHQVDYADLVLSRLGVKYLLIEVKRPGALAWNRRAVETALQQAMRYAAAQKVRSLGVSDGSMLYAADFRHGGLRDRVLVSLEAPEPPTQLWWLSVHGIYRQVEGVNLAQEFPRFEQEQDVPALRAPLEDSLLHPKYKLPASCFAYVGDPNDFRTWKLPYRLANGSVDLKRLPKAIAAILSNYRGAKVTGIPEAAVGDVLVRLARAAASVGKMPGQRATAALIYHQLAEVLEQMGRVGEIGLESKPPEATTP